MYVALDVDDTEKALSIAQEISPYVEGFKIGPRLVLKSGPTLISKLKVYGKIFLDFKFFDIPSTMESSVLSAFQQGVDLLTVHASVGEESLKRLADLEGSLKAKRDFRILAVTVLTSFSKDNLPPFMPKKSILSYVESLADLVIKSGLSALVCSGEEVAYLRDRHPFSYLVTPGIRLASNKTQDQKRVFTPEKAISSGASALVIGRPIYSAENPTKVCLDIQKLLA